MSGLRNLLPPPLGLEALLAPGLAGGAVVLFAWLAQQGVLSAGLSPAAHFPAAVGHFLTLSLLGWLAADLRRAIVWHRAEMHYSPGDGSWVDQATALLVQTSQGRGNIDRFDDQFSRLCRLLRDRLNVRIAVKYYPLAWLPLLLGLVSSTWNLQPAHVAGGSWLQVFWPFVVGALETLCLSWGIHMLSSAYDAVLGAFLLGPDPQPPAPPAEHANGAAGPAGPGQPATLPPAQQPATAHKEAIRRKG
jgi:hypothetical protein